MFPKLLRGNSDLKTVYTLSYWYGNTNDSVNWTLDNGLNVRNILSLYYSVFSFVERYLVKLFFLKFV
jgi:hypothetical protein